MIALLCFFLTLFASPFGEVQRPKLANKLPPKANRLPWHSPCALPALALGSTRTARTTPCSAEWSCMLSVSHSLKAWGRANLIFGSDNWQCHRLDARIVRIVGNVKAKFSAHDKHGRILRQHLAPYGLEVLML